jgi:hypothetical protein
MGCVDDDILWVDNRAIGHLAMLEQCRCSDMSHVMSMDMS